MKILLSIIQNRFKDMSHYVGNFPNLGSRLAEEVRYLMAKNIGVEQNHEVTILNKKIG
jgi:hypothetical protein